MTSDASTKGGKLRNVITHNMVWAGQKTESIVYRWLCALAMFDVTYFAGICLSIGRHFKHSVNTLIAPLPVWEKFCMRF